MNVPLVIDKEGVILAGHTRYRALLEMGAQTAPCVVADLPAAKAQEFRIADNKTAELAGWDMDKLVQELREVEVLDDLAIFFPDADLADLLKDGALSAIPATQAQIDTRADQLNGRFAGTSAGVTASQVEIVCAHCGAFIYINRDDVLARTAAPAA